MCGLLPPLPFDLPSCPGLPDSLVPDQVTSSDEEQVAHNSRGEFGQIIRTWLSLSLSKELPEGIPEGGHRDMYEPWIWGRGSLAQGASHSPGIPVMMGTPDSPPRQTGSGRGSQESVPIHEILMGLETLWDPGFHTPLGTRPAPSLSNRLYHSLFQWFMSPTHTPVQIKCPDDRNICPFCSQMARTAPGP